MCGQCRVLYPFHHISLLLEKSFWANFPYCACYNTSQRRCAIRFFLKSRGASSFHELGWRILVHKELVYAASLTSCYQTVKLLLLELLSLSLHFSCDVAIPFSVSFWLFWLLLRRKTGLFLVLFSRNCSLVVLNFEVRFLLRTTFVTPHLFSVLFRA